MRHRRFRGRADRASAQDVFEAALCGQRSPRRGKDEIGADRKTLQLCRQVQRALILTDVAVESVAPMGGGQLLVCVALGRDEGSPVVALARLHERSPALRATIARAICRKRVPVLSFVVVPGKGGSDATR